MKTQVCSRTSNKNLTLKTFTTPTRHSSLTCFITMALPPPAYYHQTARKRGGRPSSITRGREQREGAGPRSPAMGLVMLKKDVFKQESGRLKRPLLRHKSPIAGDSCIPSGGGTAMNNDSPERPRVEVQAIPSHAKKVRKRHTEATHTRDDFHRRHPLHPGPVPPTRPATTISGGRGGGRHDRRGRTRQTRARNPSPSM